MKSLFAAATVLALTAVVPTLTDVGSVRATQSRHLFLAEANLPSPGGHDAALAEANGPTSGGRDTALYAETESNGASPGGRDTAQA